MKKICLLLLGFMVFYPAHSQFMKNLDDVGTFNEGLLAIKKGDQWGFIDKQGTIVIQFRDDLVPSKVSRDDATMAPIFQNGRALVRRTEDDITYYGYIDKSGREVIPKDYVNASSFKNKFAVVMSYTKEVVGKNKLLGKDVVNYEIEEFVIDLNGKAMTPMLNPRHYVPDKMKSGKSPNLTAFLIGERMVAVKTAEEKWEIYRF